MRTLLNLTNRPIGVLHPTIRATLRMISKIRILRRDLRRRRHNANATPNGSTTTTTRRRSNTRSNHNRRSTQRIKLRRRRSRSERRPRSKPSRLRRSTIMSPLTRKRLTRSSLQNPNNGIYHRRSRLGLYRLKNLWNRTTRTSPPTTTISKTTRRRRRRRSRTSGVTRLSRSTRRAIIGVKRRRRRPRTRRHTRRLKFSMVRTIPGTRVTHNVTYARRRSRPRRRSSNRNHRPIRRSKQPKTKIPLGSKGQLYFFSTRYYRATPLLG